MQSSIYTKCNEDNYLHARNCKSSKAYNLCYKFAGDVISFPDQKYESIHQITNQTRPIITTVVP